MSSPFLAAGISFLSIWIDAIFSEAPHYKDDAQRAEIEGTLIQLKAHIARQLASDEEFELPCDLDLGDGAGHHPDRRALFYRAAASPAPSLGTPTDVRPYFTYSRCRASPTEL